MLFCFVHGFQFLMVRNYCSVALPSVASSFKQAARGRSDAPKISLDKFLLLIPLFFLYCFTVILQSVPWGIRRLLRLRVPWCRPCVRQAANHHCGRSFDDAVGRSRTYAHITHDCRRQFAYQYRRCSGTYDRAACMGDGWQARCLHRTGVHVCYSCSRRHNTICLNSYNLLFS